MKRRFFFRVGAVAAFGIAGMKLKAQGQKPKIKLPVSVQISAARDLSEDIVPPVFNLGGGKVNTFSSKLPWTPLVEGGFEQENKHGRRMVIQKDGLASIYGRDGKLIHSSTFPQAADLYRALVKSQEMLLKVR
ncbi:MAG: hypothetical protein NTV82_16420 [Candidatus Aminicenantes bacterium]|nr:hypothetical protein [Candidatus Aminicenantes bacterium]